MRIRGTLARGEKFMKPVQCDAVKETAVKREESERREADSDCR